MLLKIKHGRGGHNIYTKKRRKKTLRIVALVVLFLMLILVGLGVFYTWYMGQNKPVETTQEIKRVNHNPLPAVSKPYENMPVGVALQHFTSPVSKGENSSIGIRTTPTAACSIRVEYDDIASKDTGLIPKVADEFGSVEWTWTVEASRPSGTWPVEIVCAYNTRSAFYKADLVVR